MNIPKYIDLYRKDLEFKNYSNNTIKNYVSQVDLFLKSHNDISEPLKITTNQTLSKIKLPI